ncbi:prolyl oligopeptidase family serine peptidase [Arthrobacter sp. Y81]|uniref:prolyl oligopeptidase family serine peptidase n=1 Tax=Arthrobacter sp. Y81 TaxID=2058897 RepID=UPI0035BE3121
MTFEQFIYGWANALPADEARELYETFRPFTEAKVYTQILNGPLLIFSGEKDHTVPWSIAHASFNRQERNPGLTEIKEIPDRGHSLTIDHGWRDVADTALEFIKHHG